MSNTIPIISRHSTVAEAVEAAGLDLSYNPAEAVRATKHLDSDPRFTAASEAYVVDGPRGKRVLYVYTCDIRLLNEFDPFISVLDDTKFIPVTISDADDTITLHANLPLPRDNASRKVIARGKLLVSTLRG